MLLARKCRAGGRRPQARAPWLAAMMPAMIHHGAPRWCAAHRDVYPHD
ncbi:hypothetical protein ANDA3_3205 [plant metagenome]|uniref:Uncharacterized protein n=2 Tax=root TaxID=1 RepID=A0A1C3K0N8_9BURK|nr:hypothetical protein ODI_00360 [Orrella dioscoreae]SOE51114.1 hypothetical protein ODI_R3204 [Orrella dioscoreae]